jgi:hypothetical protein
VGDADDLQREVAALQQNLRCGSLPSFSFSVHLHHSQLIAAQAHFACTPDIAALTVQVIFNRASPTGITILLLQVTTTCGTASQESQSPTRARAVADTATRAVVVPVTMPNARKQSSQSSQSVRPCCVMRRRSFRDRPQVSWCAMRCDFAVLIPHFAAVSSERGAATSAYLPCQIRIQPSASGTSLPIELCQVYRFNVVL